MTRTPMVGRDTLRKFTVNAQINASSELVPHLAKSIK